MSSNTNTNFDESKEQSVNALLPRKRNYKTLNENHLLDSDTDKSLPKKLKLTPLDACKNIRPPLPDLALTDNDCAASSKNKSNVFEFQQIVADRPSEIRPGQKQYLIHWKNYPLCDASWHHADNITDGSIVDKYECLTVRTKQNRIREYNKAVRDWELLQTQNDTRNFEHKEIQCDIDNDDVNSKDSDSIEVISSYCDAEKKHWLKCTENIKQLDLMWSSKKIKIFITSITQFVLFINKHENCKDYVTGITDNLKQLYDFLETLKKVEIIDISESTSDEDEQANDDEDKQANDDEIASADSSGHTIAETSSERSPESVPGILTQQEITPDSNNPEHDVDYNPDDDEDDEDDEDCDDYNSEEDVSQSSEHKQDYIVNE